jgi:hypothetical protein
MNLSCGTLLAVWLLKRMRVETNCLEFLPSPVDSKELKRQYVAGRPWLDGLLTHDERQAAMGSTP